MSKTIFNVHKGAAGAVINIECVKVSLGYHVSILVHSFYVGYERRGVTKEILGLIIHISYTRSGGPSWTVSTVTGLSS